VDYTNSLTRITAERERANAQLRMAAQIQSAILPNQFPPFPEVTAFDLFATMYPAKLVGGDFYDFVMIDDDHLAMVIADVSDKGVPAALFMMSAKIIINYRVQMGGTPAEILMDANAQLCNENDAGMFVTVWLGVLELSTGRLTCSNAGHEYPIIRGQDGAFRVYQDRHGLMVGAMESTKYSDYEILLAPGDAVFVYTDGVSEANNAAGEFYGLERLEATLNRVGGADPREILAGVKADVDAFANGADQFDDMTMLCMVYRGGEQADAKAPERGP
jgi:sigma-B regulation protein RsbU (phosphoserine phosphatase)